MNGSGKFTADQFGAGLRPDPLLGVSDWADEYRYLPQRGSSEPGRWRTSRTPFSRDIMEALHPSSPYKRVVHMKPTQIGGTECGLNAIGYRIHLAPMPILAVQPSLADAKKVSQQRIQPMIEATPVLSERVRDSRSRDSGNTQLSKEFPGGILLLTGANSDKGLRSTPAAFVFCDEIDSYPEDVANQGDPVLLAEKRMSTFPNRKLYLCSTPTIKGISRIEREYDRSNKQVCFVPCPFCEHMQALKWKGLVWDRHKDGTHLPETVKYQCELCGRRIDEDEYKTDILGACDWRITQPEVTLIAGFWLNGLYAPIGLGLTWPELVESFVEAKQDRALLKTFVNTVLGETWEEDPDRVSEHQLMLRREPYTEKELPMQVAVLSAGADVQVDRLECEVVGWGVGHESWNIAYEIFFGNPGELDVWQLLDDFLLRTFTHASGAELPIAAVGIDTGGHHTQEVYRFLRGKARRRVFGMKGSSTPGRPLAGRPSKTNTGRVPLCIVGTDTAKDALYARLKIEDTGPGYCHFPQSLDEEYFKQLTSEVVQTRYRMGHPHRQYIKSKHARNEALDCRVYAMAALELLNADLEACAARLRRISEQAPREKETETADAPASSAGTQKKSSQQDLTLRRRKSRSRSGFVNSWKT